MTDPSSADSDAPVDLHAELVQRVRAGMATKGWSQADLAFAANLSEKHLSQMLTGRVDGALSMWQHLLNTLRLTTVTPPGGQP